MRVQTNIAGYRELAAGVSAAGVETEAYGMFSKFGAFGDDGMRYMQHRPGLVPLPNWEVGDDGMRYMQHRPGVRHTPNREAAKLRKPVL